MSKDFDNWNIQKKGIDTTTPELYFSEREIWWVSLGVNVGFEQDGKNDNFARPVLVLKKFSKNVYIGIPLTTSSKSGKYYYHFEFNGENSNALLSQIRLLDSKRFIKKMGTLDKVTFFEIKQKVKDIL